MATRPGSFLPVPRLRWLSLLVFACGLPVLAGPRPGSAAVPAKTAKGSRKPLPALGSLPAPAAKGPLRILLVDDDFSDNNHAPGDPRLSPSDVVFRRLVAEAVGGDPGAWEVEPVKAYSDGPGFERLRPFPLVLWYTGASYGGGSDNSSVLSVEDEKAVRRYLEETGGAVILVSPGYLSKALSYDSTWEHSTWPFLHEVLGIRGGYGLAQRFSASPVIAADGSRYQVGKGSPELESQFSIANPDGAAVVFRAELAAPSAGGPTPPVATAAAYGRGRIVYVGFTIGNLADAELSPAFGALLAATGLRTGQDDPARKVRAVALDGSRPVSLAPAPGAASAAGPATPEPSPTGPPGPGPADLEVSAVSPAFHNLRWLTTGFMKFEVHRRDPGGWKLLKAGFREQFYTDPSFVAPNSAYRVVALHDDGRRGSTTVEYPAPPQPEGPRGLVARQTGAGAVQLVWTHDPRATAYRVFGPGGPADGVPARALGSHDLAGLAVGIHELRVASVFGALVSPVDSTVRVAVNPDRGRYRLVFRGLQVVRGTRDDPPGADGQGDEVYAGAFWATASLADPSSQAAGAAVGGGFARSRVYGDTQGFPDRIKAGSARAATGGLKDGDAVPDVTMMQPVAGMAVTADQFPLLLWEGELVDGGPAVGVLPVAFEWDATDHGQWNWWADHWNGNGTILQNLGQAMRFNRLAPVEAQELHGYVSFPGGDRPQVPGFTIVPGRDRPIGLFQTTAAGTTPEYGWKPMGFVLARSKVERALAGQAARVLSLAWAEHSPELGGAYTGYFQLERLSAPPLEVPAPPQPLAAVPMTAGIMVPMGVAAGTPSPSPSPTSPTRTVVASGAGIGQQSLQAPAEAPVGPAPTNLRFRSDSPVRHFVNWDLAGDATFDVFRRVGDRWQPVVTGGAFKVAQERAFVPPGTRYQVVARYPDGREGRAEADFTAPAQPEPVTGLRAEQLGPGRVRVSWTNRGGSALRGFRVFSPGGPADGLLVPWQTEALATVELAGLPEGDSSIRVTPQHEELVAPGGARVTAVVEPWSGRYRAVLLGFRAQRKSHDDDLLDGDGKGDEVFVGAYRASIPKNGPPVPLGLARSVVLGDTNRFPDRVRAGSGTPTGGIVAGDVVPSDAAVAVQPGVAAALDRLPLLLWEGLLVNGGDPVALLPAAFEWDDGSSSTSTWNSWQGWWSSPNGSRMLAATARQALVTKPDQLARTMLTETYPAKYMGTVDVNYPYCPTYPLGPGRTRPLGVLQLDGLTWQHVPFGLVLTRSNVEKALGNASATVVAFKWEDQEQGLWVLPTLTNSASYVAYIQIERLPAASP